MISLWNSRLQNVGLFGSLKRPVSKHLSTVNMLNGPKDYFNLHGSIFVIFFDHYWKKITSEDSVLVVSDILRLFVNILTPNDKYSLAVKASL